MSFLDALLGRVNEVSPEDIKAAEVADSPAEGEEVIGELTEAEKSIYAVLHAVTGKIVNLSKEHKKTHEALDAKKILTEEDMKNQVLSCSEFHEKVDNLKEEKNIIQKIFWKSVQDRLAETGKDVSNIGVRKDWKVVILNPEKEMEFPGFGIIGIDVQILRKDGQPS